MQNPLNVEIQSLSPTAVIELFAVTLPDTSTLYFHAGTNAVRTRIVWGGINYEAIPIMTEGFDITTQGALPTPTMTISNIGGAISSFLIQMDDIVGSVVRRKRTFKRFLDAANFPEGVNAEADPTQTYPDDIYVVEQKEAENKQIVRFKLSSALDAAGVKLPRRIMATNICPWIYRGADCAYVGTSYWNVLDQVVGTLGEDVCGKRLGSCKLRYGANGPMNFGGFPGIDRLPR